MAEWLDREHGALSYRLTQVLSGHGCFGRYLCRIGREPTPECQHCSDRSEDTTLHTLAVCSAWDSQRRVLVAAIGIGALLLSTLVLSMVSSESAWNAAASFAEEVLSSKEAAERERKRDPFSLPKRSGRTRRRRQRDDLRPP